MKMYKSSTYRGQGRDLYKGVISIDMRFKGITLSAKGENLNKEGNGVHDEELSQHVKPRWRSNKGATEKRHQ